MLLGHIPPASRYEGGSALAFGVGTGWLTGLLKHAADAVPEKGL